jgi:hypothetical protein
LAEQAPGETPPELPVTTTDTDPSRGGTVNTTRVPVVATGPLLVTTAV